tara:strand:- start:229 stop:441 length:213 start_codon:yes stop_codon:yes gene_type:complete
MAVPKRKTTPSKRNMRRSYDSLNVSNSVECPNCGELKLSHHVCQSCGYYNKKLIIRSKDADSDEDSDSND